VLLVILKNQVEERRTSNPGAGFVAELQDLNRWFKNKRWEDEPIAKRVKPTPGPELPTSKVKAFTTCGVCGWAGKSFVTGFCPDHAGQAQPAGPEPTGDDAAEVARVLAQISSSLPKMPDATNIEEEGRDEEDRS